MKNKSFIIVLLFTAISINAFCQEQVIRLWQGAAPRSESWTQKEVQYKDNQGQDMFRNVVVPTLTVYKPDPAKANGRAVIVAPGGGFLYLSWQNEGTQVAEWLVNKGVTVFLLKYRLTNSGESQEDFQKALEALFRSIHAANNPQNSGKPEVTVGNTSSLAAITPLAQEDGRQAIRVVRQRATEWGIDPHKIGILGFSAGGMLTLGPLLQHDANSRPDFAGVIYAPWTVSAIPEDAPPLFLLCAADDNLCALSSAQLFSAYKSAAKSVELHIYAKGGHGFGMQKQNRPVNSWIERFYDWMTTSVF